MCAFSFAVGSFENSFSFHSKTTGVRMLAARQNDWRRRRWRRRWRRRASRSIASGVFLKFFSFFWLVGPPRIVFLVSAPPPAGPHRISIESSLVIDVIECDLICRCFAKKILLHLKKNISHRSRYWPGFSQGLTGLVSDFDSVLLGFLLGLDWVWTGLSWSQAAMSEVLPWASRLFWVLIR